MIAFHKEETALAEYFKHILVKQKQGLIIAITGNETYETGTGKSHSAIQLARQIDSNFNMKKIVYYVWQFLDALDEVERSKQFGQVIVIDEGGLAAGSNNYHSVLNQTLNTTMQTFRNLGCMAIFCMPNLKDIDARIRRKFSHHGWTRKIVTSNGKVQVYLYMYIRRKNMFNDDRDRTTKHPITMVNKIEGHPEYNHIRLFEKFLVAKLPKEISEPYEEMAFMEKSIARKDMARLARVVKGEEDKKGMPTPQEVIKAIRMNPKDFLEVYNKDMKTLDIAMLRHRFNITADSARIAKRLHDREFAEENEDVQ